MNVFDLLYPFRPYIAKVQSLDGNLSGSHRFWSEAPAHVWIGENAASYPNHEIHFTVSFFGVREHGGIITYKERQRILDFA